MQLLILVSCNATGARPPTPVPTSTSVQEIVILRYSLSGGDRCDEIAIASSGTVKYEAPCAAKSLTGTVPSEVLEQLTVMAAQFQSTSYYLDLESPNKGPIGEHIVFRGAGAEAIADFELAELRSLSMVVLQDMRRQAGLAPQPR